MKLLFALAITFGLFGINNYAKADYCYSVAQGNAADGANGTTNMQYHITAETNQMAGTICYLLNIVNSDITRALFAFVLVVMGFGAYMGKINLGLIVSFTLGVAGISALPAIIRLMAPYSNFGAGCNCNRYVIVGYNDGTSNQGPIGYGVLPNGSPGYIWQDLGLNPDCTAMNPVPAAC